MRRGFTPNAPPPRGPAIAPTRFETGPPPLRADAEVLENRPEGGGNRRLLLRIAGWPGSGPGQFAMLSPGALGAVPRTDPLLPRPMAVYRERAAGGAAEVEILYKITGRGTALLGDAVSGDRVGVVGPLGRMFSTSGAGRAVIVAGGTGIASVYSLAAQLAGQVPVAVLLGARSGADLLGQEDFAALDVELRVATEDGSAGVRGVVTDLLGPALDAEGPPRVFACGPTPMMRAAAALSAERGHGCVVSLENRMACGFGVCLGCAVPLARGGFALVCRDGPMFESGALEWEPAE